MHFPKLFILAAIGCVCHVSAHPSHDHEHRDLKNIYYGPDTDNINFLPLPKPSLAVPVDPKLGYYLEHIGSGTYFITEGVYQTIFLVSDVGVIVVDCPPSIGYKFKKAIESVTDKPVTHFVYSHAHADHVGGAFIFNETVREYIAHDETRKLLERISIRDPLRPIPNVVFEKDKVVRVGNQTLELSYKGPNHLEGNIFIYAPCAKTLMLVDVVFPGWVPFSELAASVDVAGYINAHDQILEYNFTKYIGGHVDHYGTRKDVVKQKHYIQDLYKNCVEAINVGVNASVALGPVSQANPGNPWAQFKVYLKTAADQCAERTNRKWLGQLAGVEIFGWENAFKMMESVRLDFGVLGPAAGIQPPT